MTYTPFTPITIGSLAWGAPVNNALKALDEAQATNAKDHNWIAWTFDPATNLATSSLTLGTPFMSKVWVRQPITANFVYASVSTLGVGLTAGQNFAGVYDSAGNRIGVTADQTTPWTTTTGLQTMALTAPLALSPGAYYLTLLTNGGTSPTFARGSALSSGASTVNGGLTATDARYATGPAAQTTLPLSIAMGARTTSGISMWSAIG